jgi:hypothetical protein
LRDPIAIVHRNLADSAVRMALPQKAQPYYFALSYGRHIGYQYDAKGKFWVARYRAKASKYRRRRLGVVAEEGQPGLTYDEAVQKAWEWFSTARIPSSAPFAKPLSATRHLHVCALGEEPTVGHALEEWVAWKRVAAAKSHFEAALSLINHHIVPRLASVRLSEFNGTILREFINDVLETAPKRGNQRLGPRRSRIRHLRRSHGRLCRGHGRPRGADWPLARPIRLASQWASHHRRQISPVDASR